MGMKARPKKTAKPGHYYLQATTDADLECWPRDKAGDPAWVTVQFDPPTGAVGWTLVPTPDDALPPEAFEDARYMLQDAFERDGWIPVMRWRKRQVR